MSQNGPRVQDFATTGVTPSRSHTDTTGLQPPGPGVRSRSTTAPTHRHGVFPDDFHSSEVPPASPFFASEMAERRTSGLSSPRSPNRFNRADTVHAYNRPDMPNWQPGAEPGLDPSREEEDPGMHRLHEECDITVIDFSAEHMDVNDLNNETLKGFLDKPRPEWVDCRWICVNGLSWDVIKQLGKYKDLHPLAVEDITNRRTRTKADWYSDHAYFVLTLQKLVRLHHEGSMSYESQEAETIHEEARKYQRVWTGLFGSHNTTPDSPVDSDDSSGRNTGLVKAHSSTSPDDPVRSVRTLHSYKVDNKSAASKSRASYMEANSALASRDLAVSLEQVSLFLASDNVVLSFFEHSAADVLDQLTQRISSKDTILRRSCDASMLIQSIIDVIVDLAFPVAEAYEDAISSLEFDVLVDPDMGQPRKLYILSSEIAFLRSKLAPIGSLVNALRDHHSTGAPLTPGVTGRPTHNAAPTPVTTVEISSLAQTYLGDVDDHIIMLTGTLDQLNNSADALTNLIFNTMGAYQNESMKVLTLVSMFFLPLTFLTGYFGQNFKWMWSVQQNSDVFFWYIAIPVQIVVLIYFMRSMIYRLYQRIGVRRWITKQAKVINVARMRKEAADRRRMRTFVAGEKFKAEERLDEKKDQKQSDGKAS